MDSRISFLKGDITSLNVDVIVNAANQALCGGGGVYGAIHRAAGSDLLAECRMLGGCKTGQAKLTKGYRLPARNIIHTVGPVWFGGHKNEESLLASCYRESIELANTCGAKTIAFPSISTGAYKFPLPKACTIALKEVNRSLHTKTNIQQVIFVAYDEKTLKEYRRASSMVSIGKL